MLPAVTASAEAEILLNFKEAPLRAVLEYLSEEAGLVILGGDDVDGRISVISRQPLNTDEAVALLDSVLREGGYAAIRTGRTLKIVLLDEAVKANLPVFSGNDPTKVLPSDKLITQIIPVRYAVAARLKTDLAPLISDDATFTTNEASNSLILVDTQANIRRIMEIISALDEGMAGVTEVKVYKLENAVASDTAELIDRLFQQESGQQSSRSSSPFSRFSMMMGGRGSRGGDDRSRGGSSNQQGAAKQRVVATADDRTNTLLVSASPDSIKIIDGIIEELEANPTEQESVFIYPVKNAQAANLETVVNEIFSESTSTSGRSTSGRSSSGGSPFSRFGRSSSSSQSRTPSSAGDLVGQVYVVADEDTNSLLVRTPSKFFDRVREILEELDRPIPQVLIKILLAEVTRDTSTDVGIEFSALNIRVGSSNSSVGTDYSVASQTGGLITKVVDSDYTATLRALATVGTLDVLSRPYILASDNQEASITVGQEVPFIRNTRTTETGQTINTIEYEDIGIILNVTPHINPGGLVIMDVQPEISTLTGTTVPISETVDASVFAKRSAQTRVAIPNGHTIVIGGLMEDRHTDTISKVPVLGDIPLLGALFRRTIKAKVKTELLIFLTPHVAEEPAMLQAMSKEEVAGSEAVKGAAGDEAFAEHMKGLQRGATTRPGEPTTRPGRPTTRPRSAPGH